MIHEGFHMGTKDLSSTLSSFKGADMVVLPHLIDDRMHNTSL